MSSSTTWSFALVTMSHEKEQTNIAIVGLKNAAEYVAMIKREAEDTVFFLLQHGWEPMSVTLDPSQRTVLYAFKLSTEDEQQQRQRRCRHKDLITRGQRDSFTHECKDCGFHWYED